MSASLGTARLIRPFNERPTASMERPVMPYSIIPQPGWRELDEARERRQDRDRAPSYGLVRAEARSFGEDRFEALRRLEEDAENG